MEDKHHHPENDPAYKGLKVQSGVASAPPIVNPHFRRRRLPELSVEQYVEAIVAGDITRLSQAVTLVESTLEAHRAKAQAIIEGCLPYAGKSIRIGITGVPGAGKSTSIDSFGMHLVRQGRKLAVLAIDPTSEVSRGSILGDKTRMEQLAREPNAFIRPSAAGDSVGQSETAVHSMVDFFLLIQLAGTGDELQGIKRGIMEMADGIVINKADGENVDAARLAAAHFRNALQLFPQTESGWEPKVLTYSGYYATGIKEIFDMIDKYRHYTVDTGYFELKRQRQAKWWMYEAINDALKHSFFHNEAIEKLLPEMEHAVQTESITPFVAAHRLLSSYYNSISQGTTYNE